MRAERSGNWARGNSLLRSQEACSMPEASSSKGVTAGRVLLPSHFSHAPASPHPHISETRQSLLKEPCSSGVTRTPLSSPAPLQAIQSERAQFSNSQNSTLPRCPKAMHWRVSTEVRLRSEPTPEGSDQEDRDRARIACPGLHEDPPLVGGADAPSDSHHDLNNISLPKAATMNQEAQQKAKVKFD